MQNSSDCVIELNSFARGIRVDRTSGMVTVDTPPDQLLEISRRCLLKYWREDGRGGLAPADLLPGRTVIPDEVVVRGPDGRTLYRRTIIDEKMERWFSES
jgi:hypothetical protein